MEIKAGLDFGTTTSIFSYMDRGKIEKFTYGGETDLGTTYVPSLVAYGEDFIQIGHYARDLSSAKASLYKYFKMLLPEDDKNNWSEEYGPYLRESRTPAEVATDYIGELIKGASPYRTSLGGDEVNLDAFEPYHRKEIDGLIVSVPHVWHDVKATGRSRLQEVIRSLGLPLIGLISEPIAAAAFFAYRYHKNNGASYKGNLLVCDMGGGTFDVALCRMLPGRVEVLLNEGNGEKGLGIAGAHFDIKLIEQKLGDKFKTLDSRQISELLISLDTQKKSSNAKAKLINCILYPDDNDARINEVYEVASKSAQRFLGFRYEEIVKAFDCVRDGIHSVLNRVKTAAVASEYPIDKVVMVGGFSKFPLVQRAIEEAFADKVVNQKHGGFVDDVTLNSDSMAYAISFGACLVANQDVQVSERYEHTIGINAYSRQQRRDIRIELIKAGEPLDSLSAPRFCQKDGGENRQFEIDPNKETVSPEMFIVPNNRGESEIKTRVQLREIPNRNLSRNSWMIGARVDSSKVPYLVIRDVLKGVMKEYPLALLPEIWEVDETTTSK